MNFNLPGIPERHAYKRKLTNEDVETIKRLYADGVTAIELAKRYKVSAKYIQDLVPPRKPRRKHL